MSDSRRPPDRRAPPPHRPAGLAGITRSALAPGPGPQAQALPPDVEATRLLPDDEETTEPVPGALSPLAEDDPTVPPPMAPTELSDGEPLLPGPVPLSDEPTVLRPLTDEPTAPPRARPPVARRARQSAVAPAPMAGPQTFTRPDTPEPPPIATPPPSARADEGWSHSMAPELVAVPARPARRRLLRVRFLAGGLVGSVSVFAMFQAYVWMSAPVEAPAGLEPSAQPSHLPIHISVDADGVPITIDGAEVGSAPTEVTLAVGSHEVVVGSKDAATAFQLEVGAGVDAWCFGQRQGRFYRTPCAP